MDRRIWRNGAAALTVFALLTQTPAAPVGTPGWVWLAAILIMGAPGIIAAVNSFATRANTEQINRAVNHQPEDAPKLIDYAKGSNVATAEILEKLHIAAMKVEQVAVKAEDARILAAEAVERNEDTLAVAHQARDFAKKAARESGRALELSLLGNEQLHDLIETVRIVEAVDVAARRGEIERRRETLARIREERAEDDGAET